MISEYAPEEIIGIIIKGYGEMLLNINVYLSAIGK